MFIEKDHVADFFNLMNSSGIKYVLIKNIGNELPDKLEDGKDIDILVHEDDVELFEKAMVLGGFKRVIHPLGQENGWKFAYKLREFQFWKKRDVKQDFYVDAAFKLCCKGLMPKVWIPLDSSINNEIWASRIFDKKNGWWTMDSESLFCYLIIRSIFDKRQFSQAYVKEIESRKNIINHEVVRNKLEKVFFKYTDRLMDLIKTESYSLIISDFISYKAY